MAQPRQTPYTLKTSCMKKSEPCFTQHRYVDLRRFPNTKTSLALLHKLQKKASADYKLKFSPSLGFPLYHAKYTHFENNTNSHVKARIYLKKLLTHKKNLYVGECKPSSKQC